MGENLNNTDQSPSADTTTKATLQRLVDDLKRLNWITVGVLMVVSIAAGGLLVNYEASKQASYEDLKDQVLIQNQKIDALTKAIQAQKQ